MAEEHFVPLSLLPPSRSQQSLALGIAVVLLLIAVASQPFAQIQIAPITAFAPVVAAIELVSYGLTATLLFATYSVRPVAAILALATGYVFTGLAIIAWASSFPGAFAANGLLGNSPQISFYLAYFINAGIGVSALAYVALSGAEDRPGRPRRHIVFATLMAVLMAAGATAFVVTFADRLPPMMFDEVHVSPNWRYVAPLYLVLYVAAIAAVAYRRRSVLDTWLLLALWGWLLESVMLIRFQYRFTVGWYVSLFFEFFSASVVLAALLSQLTALYGRLALAMTALQRERENRMLTVNAALASVAHETNQPISAIEGRSGRPGTHRDPDGHRRRRPASQRCHRGHPRGLQRRQRDAGGARPAFHPDRRVAGHADRVAAARDRARHRIREKSAACLGQQESAAAGRPQSCRERDRGDGLYRGASAAAAHRRGERRRQSSGDVSGFRAGHRTGA